MSRALHILGLGVRWPLGIFSLLWGVAMALNGDVLSGVGIALIGAALLPVFQRAGKIKLTPWVRVGVVIAWFVVFVVGVPRKNPSLAPVIETERMSSTTFSGGSQGSVDKSQQAPQTVTVVSVVDGDTIRVKLADGKEEKVRIIGLDAPEMSPLECFGTESFAYLFSLIVGKDVTLENEPQDDRDGFGRLLRYIALNGQDIGAIMIRDGYAGSYRKYQHSHFEAYNAIETAAKERKAGLWSVCASPAENPSQTSVVAPTAQPMGQEPQVQTGEQGCVIKGNVNTKKEKIYHLPGCGSYTQTQIKPEEGDRWFCTESEAQAAGFRKARNCG